MSDPLVLAFGGREIAFALPIKRVLEVERECGDKSIVTMLEEMSAGIGIAKDDGVAKFVGVGAVRIKDVAEIIRCAAIGGGMAPNDAAMLVNEYVDGQPYSETVPVAWAILNATIMGVRLKKKEGEAADPAPSTVEA